MGIPEPAKRFDEYPHQLSGGMRQRVMIAIAMACEPDLMICDEPTTALDVTIQKQVLELLVTLQKNHKMGLLFISHDLSVVAELAHYVAVMKKGVIVELGKAADIFTRPQDPYTKGLLACRPSLGDNPKRLLTVKDFSKDSLPPEKLEIKTERKFDDKKNPVILEVKNCTKKLCFCTKVPDPWDLRNELSVGSLKLNTPGFCQSSYFIRKPLISLSN